MFVLNIKFLLGSGCKIGKSQSLWNLNSPGILIVKFDDNILPIQSNCIASSCDTYLHLFTLTLGDLLPNIGEALGDDFGDTTGDFATVLIGEPLGDAFGDETGDLGRPFGG